MNRTVKKQWTDALRSGEYKQTRGQLCNGVGFCCLGVLVDITVDGEWVNAASLSEGQRDISKGWGIKVEDKLVDFITLPLAVRDHLGLDVDDIDRLQMMNDGPGYGGSPPWLAQQLNVTKRHNFKQIADWIDENL